MIIFLLLIIVVSLCLIVWLASEADRWMHIADLRKNMCSDFRQCADEATKLATEQHQAILDLQTKYGIGENKDSGS